MYNFRSGAPADQLAVERMTRLLAHRGPDAEGFHYDRELGLGHRRLSILDLSERGRQPMVGQDGRFVIAYNGEVYNYLELRTVLEAKGHVFRTDTDTEVVLALYAQDGVKCVDRFNGMFALAIWDSLTRTLFLARDRAGIKPLYYAETPNGLMFASEAKALFASQQVSPQVAGPLIDTFLTYGYIPGEDTLFQGIRKLLPGYWLLVSPEGIKSAAYWDLSYAPNARRTPEDTAAELRALLLDAMRIHLRSDVPVGVFLSGGLDSSTTVALLHEAGFQNLKTFSVAYREGRAYDETRYARLIADRFQTDHHVLYLEPNRFLECIPHYVWHMDEPVTEAAAISLYCIAKLLRQHVTVALSGEGADELFAGYDIYRYMQWIEKYRKLPEKIRLRLLEPVLGNLGGSIMRKYLRLARQPLAQRYRGVSLPEIWYKDSLYTNEFRDTLDSLPTIDPLARYYATTQAHDALTQMLYSDFKTWLVDDLLIKADKMTMANSVELRVPFLDYRVVEYAATIPSSMKLRRTSVKWVLKRAMQDRLPSETLTRKKAGFPTPLAHMFQADLSPYLCDLLLSDTCRTRSYFKPQVVENLIQEHVKKRWDHHKILWQLVVLEEWHRQFIDRPVLGVPPRH
jgi:asparagine synthase (glutamine-hydrolysing)